MTADSAARVHQCLAQETDFAIVTRFLNSAPLLDFARRVTGNTAIAFAGAPRLSITGWFRAH